MQLIHALAAGVRGAEGGTAELYVRGTTQRANYYVDFEATQQVDGNVDVALDGYGRAVVYVSQLVNVVIKDAAGVPVHSDGMVAGGYDAAVEVRSPSFTGVHYGTGAAAASNPLTLEQVLDLWKTTNGGTDWKVLVGGSSVTLPEVLAGFGEYLLSVKAPAYAAVGDGVEDDTVPIQEALDAAGADGRVVFFPPGTYRVTSALTWPAGVNLLGVEGRSILAIDHATNVALTSTADGTTRKWCTGISFSAQQANTRSLVTLLGNAEIGFSNCIFSGTNVNPDPDTQDYGLVDVGEAAHTTDVVFIGCRFDVVSELYGEAIGKTSTTGNSIITMLGCLVTLTATARAVAGAAFPLVAGAKVIANGVHFDLSAASAVSATDEVYLFAGENSGSLVASGVSVTDLASGIAILECSSTPDIHEAGNDLGGFGLAIRATSVPVAGSQIQNRSTLSDTSNAAAIACPFALYRTVNIINGNDTVPTLSATTLTGELAVLKIRKTGGTSLTVVFGTGFGDIQWDGLIASGEEVALLLACFNDGTGLAWHQIGDATEY